LSAYILDPAIEQTVESAVEHSENSSHLSLAPQQIRNIQERVRRFCGAPDSSVVLLTSSGSRFFMRQITESIAPNLTVLSHNEIPPEARIVSLGAVN
jgi:flagellar biosynthesis protein FlhA